ncbi:carbonic anhydrase 2-like [Plodia interpunctella]|uniref:carbonic anhydrase 2-like n=1 Tax=Plodia interpunctella TaxID=58824 RepID=UPI002368009F|nr:carbonic anhydrase 2-like [Plodia interpunctella]
MISYAVLFLSCLYGVSGQWSYNDETQWAGKCNIGQQQSPINIMTRDTVLDVSGTHIQGPLVFRGYSNVKVSAFNNGHTLRWDNVDGNPPPVVEGGPLQGNYSFMQFHLHWLSEHAIDGIKYPLEIHMVHIKTGLTVEEALARPDGLAVLGIMAQVVSGIGSSYALDQIIPVVPEILDQSQPHTDPSHIDLTRLFSPEPQSYFTYAGSLTTPNCEEAVTWIVMDKPIIMSDEQFKVFSEVNVGTITNYRRLQPVNRIVYRSMASCAMTLAPSLLSALTAIFHCISGKISSSIAKGICYVINVKRKFFGNAVKECSKTLL